MYPHIDLLYLFSDQLVFYVEACESGSMFHNFTALPDINGNVARFFVIADLNHWVDLNEILPAVRDCLFFFFCYSNKSSNKRLTLNFYVGSRI